MVTFFLLVDSLFDTTRFGILLGCYSCHSCSCDVHGRLDLFGLDDDLGDDLDDYLDYLFPFDIRGRGDVLGCLALLAPSHPSLPILESALVVCVFDSRGRRWRNYLGLWPFSCYCHILSWMTRLMALL